MKKTPDHSPKSTHTQKHIYTPSLSAANGPNSNLVLSQYYYCHCNCNCHEMSVLLQRVRESGKCPPTLLTEDRNVPGDGFEDTVASVLDPQGFYLRADPETPDLFASLLQKTQSSDRVTASTDILQKAVLEQRRAILLAIVGASNSENPALTRILTNGYLSEVKNWLDDILNGVIGGVDLLLHLLTSIADLPVTKTTVKSSGLGKAVGSIEKHRLCKASPNESAIVQRVQRVKESWQASVKARKIQDTSKEIVQEITPSSAKRTQEAIATSPTTAKRVKVGGGEQKGSSFSSLLKKVSGSPKSTDSTATGSGSQSAVSNGALNIDGKALQKTLNSLTGKAPKKVGKRVKWSDHFGGELEKTKLLDAPEASEVEVAAESGVSWSDRKKRDRMREKELLSKVKKAKLLDDEEGFDMPKRMQPTATWRTPALLPDRSEVTRPQLVSPETTTQNERMKSVAPSRYGSDYEIPSSPAPLSDVEQALDMTSQSSAVVAPIPFFVPEAPAPAPVPVSAPAPTYPLTAQVPQTPYPPAALPAQDILATPEFVQALGLPMFLVGQDVQALQTLASSPSLLSTLVDANGMYDQPRLMSLVQTLSASAGGRTAKPAVGYTGANGMYGEAPTNVYGQHAFPAPAPPRNNFRSTSSEGNLHVSGYGPTTTEAEIISVFSPYVQVDEVVMKGTFAFVNTSDPINAQRAREALNGTLVGGMPVRINAAQRKNRDTANTYGNAGGGGVPAMSAPPSLSGLPPFAGSAMPGVMPPPPGPNPGMGMPPQVNVDNVRDDRGNPATKNLFVAGFGPGTTEAQLREVVGLHATVVGVVSKGTFSFVNTSDRASAVRAREALSGTMLNGGVLRINFAKETGRLGTSFDLTYGPNTGPNAGRGNPNGGRNPNSGPQQQSYYGRMF